VQFVREVSGSKVTFVFVLSEIGPPHRHAGLDVSTLPTDAGHET
jgi:hypothetical protein